MSELPAGFIVEDKSALPDGFVVTEPKKRPLGKEIGRQLGLTARYAVEGAASLPGMIANIPAAAYNAGADVLQGDEGYRFPDQNYALSQALSSAGVPQAETSTERVVGDVSRALAGLGTGGPAAELAGAPGYVAGALNNKLGTQAASAIGASGASGITRELGGGPISQLIAGVAGGVIPVGGYQITARGLKDLYGAGRDAVKPFTTSGREQVVGGILAESADDAQRAADNLNNVQTYIPDSPVTTGEAAGDAGLAGLQRGFRNQGSNPFSDIESQQNAARQAALDMIAGTPQELQGAIQNRSMMADPLYERAQTELLAKKNFSVIIDKINAALQNVGTETQAGKELIRIKSAINETLPVSPVKGRLGAGGGLEKRMGSYSPRDVSQGGLVQLYRELRDRAAKVSELEGAYPAAVRGVVKPIVRDLGQSLENQSPALRSANDTFRKLSPEIEQMQVLQDIKQRASLAASPDIRTGQEFLSQPKLSGMLRDPELSRTLTPEQLRGLQSVASDAERSASLNARNVRPSGSDTIANANGAKVVKQFLSEHAVGRLPLGLGKLVESMSEKQIKELTIEALKDPQLAHRLLIELKPETASQPYSGAAAQAFVAQILGASRGVTTQQKAQ